MALVIAMAIEMTHDDMVDAIGWRGVARIGMAGSVLGDEGLKGINRLSVSGSLATTAVSYRSFGHGRIAMTSRFFALRVATPPTPRADTKPHNTNERKF